ncbi:Smr/MutS family protein [Desulfovibrio sp. OttesenSCG-928-C06]|nr:Smr/MutS family protein [Desulfovibrio sp. OttesenSCG-928-C06]
MDSRSLNILEFPKLLDVLAGFAVSESGTLACRALGPAASLEEIREQADFFVQGRLWLEATGFKLTNFPELDVVLERLQRNAHSLDIDALWTLRQVLGQARNLVDSITQADGVKLSAAAEWPLLSEYCASYPLPQKSVSALYRCLTDEGFIRDEASPELTLVRGELRRIHQQCNRRVGDFAREYNIGHYLQDEYVTLSSDRYVLPLKSNFKGRLQGIIHDYSQTGETCYFEPMFLVELNNRLQELKREEREEERKIVLYLCDLLASEEPLLRSAYNLMIRLDVLQAKKKLAELYDGNMVAFEDGHHIELKDARHPLLAVAAAMSRRDKSATGGRGESAPRATQRGIESVVASDIVLKPGQKALIISGGNAGGKTVCLKTLGLAALMGMCAIPVPAGKGSVLPFWKHILPFIGDDQSLEDHVSTFTAQITQLAEHWEQVSSGTLIILDEFGAGTDPSQGAALAQAVIDGLLDRGAYVFAATHFPALKAYALSKDGVRAASVLFDPRTRKPLFKLVYDQVGASQALDVAREHGLPEDVLKRAQHYLLLDGDDTSQLIERLNSLAVSREEEIGSLRQETVRYEQKRSRLEEQFAEQRKKLFEEIQAEAQKVLRDWKASRVSHKQALKALSELRTGLARSEQGEAPEAADTGKKVDIARLLPGQQVFYAPWGKKGTVLELDERRGKVRIDFSGVTMWVDLADLREQEQTKPSKAPSDKGSRGVIGPRAANTYQRLDLRGKRADFALSELAGYIDSAILGGRDAVEILHGRGTGALRREVHAFLKGNPAVKTYSLAPEDQGGDGVTFVELK